jgi:hypothetical protein
MSRRRLEGETIRDAILSVTGNLDPTANGPALPFQIKGNLSLGEPESFIEDVKLDGRPQAHLGRKNAHLFASPPKCGHQRHELERDRQAIEPGFEIRHEIGMSTLTHRKTST